jgi:hypothetical protein
MHFVVLGTHSPEIVAGPFVNREHMTVVIVEKTACATSKRPPRCSEPAAPTPDTRKQNVRDSR